MVATNKERCYHSRMLKNYVKISNEMKKKSAGSKISCGSNGRGGGGGCPSSPAPSHTLCDNHKIFGIVTSTVKFYSIISCLDILIKTL